MRKQEDRSCVVRFLKDEEGATAIEYGLLAALISVGIAGVGKLLGDELISTFTTIKNAMVDANANAAPAAPAAP